MDAVHVPWRLLAVVVLCAGLAAGLAVACDGREPMQITGVTGETDADFLDVTVRHPGCGLPRPSISVDEGDDIIQLSAVYECSGDRDDVLLDTTVPVELERPLGSRSVVVADVDDDVLGPACEVDGEPSDRCSRA